MIAHAVPCAAAMSAPPALRPALAVLIEAVDAAVLHKVLGLLLERAEPVRQAEVLRAAVLELLDASAAMRQPGVQPQPAVKRPAAAQRRPASPRRVVKRAEGSSLDGPHWSDLRPRIRKHIAHGVSDEEIAAGLHIAVSTLRRVLTRT